MLVALRTVTGRLTMEADCIKYLLVRPGSSWLMSNVGATFIRISAFTMRSLANLSAPGDRPSMSISGPKAKRSRASLPANVHNAIAPYICRLNCTPTDTPVSRMNGLARVNLRCMTSCMWAMGSHGPSIWMSDLHTGHLRGLLDRSQSVTHESMQSWCASSVHGHGSTQEPGGSVGSSSVKQTKHRRGVSIESLAVSADDERGWDAAVDAAEGSMLWLLTLSSWRISRSLEAVVKVDRDSYAWDRCIFCVKLDARQDSAKTKEEGRSFRLSRQIQINASVY